MNTRCATVCCRESERTRCLIRDSGFTLVEVIAVLVIVAIVAVTVVPAMDSMQSSRSTAAATHLLRDLSYARQRAISTGRACWVEFDNGWSLHVETPDQPGRANAVPIVDAATGRAHHVQVATLYQSPLPVADFDQQQRIGFDWMGQPLVDDETPLQSPGTVTIAAHHVTIQPETGHASYSQP